MWLLPALGVLGAGIVLRALRWRLLFDAETRPPVAATTRALLIGYFFSNVLPARAGEAIRVVSLHHEAGTSRAEALGTAVTERVYDVLALLVLLFVATPWLPEVTWLRRAAVVAILVIAFSFWLVMVAFDLGLSFGAAVLVMVTTNLAMVIPSSPAALGVFEASTLVALSAYGVDDSLSLSYAVVLHGLNFFPFVAVGLLLLRRHGSLLRGTAATRG